MEPKLKIGDEVIRVNCELDEGLIGVITDISRSTYKIEEDSGETHYWDFHKTRLLTKLEKVMK